MRTARAVDADPYRSAPAVKVAQWVREFGLTVDEEWGLGTGHRLDIYLPELHAGIEVNGPHHHKKHDQERADLIFSTYSIPILPVSTDIAQSAFWEMLRAFVAEWADSTEEREEGGRGR